ncbi:MAG: ATP-binding protein [Methylocystis sp.]|nr:ATP-binding protein [Methylocystis sp.]MCA3584068.1 ATP-binding protein [Methylocystis sp.]MCA3588966.1 ATP-binding protein [Methylocystis sp.]MCA3591188.1 ATP-binding protein [Methylocystis sp.]
MNMPLQPAQFQVNAAEGRRDLDQPADRMIGKVVALNGARATISSIAMKVEGAGSDFWSIGKLISINLGSSRIVGMVYEMAVRHEQWDDNKPNLLMVQVELVGEVVDQPDGALLFRRGITVYPWPGATAHRIRNGDLRAVFDIGERKGVEIGRISQDGAIPAVVSIEDMLSKHFAVVGTTGVGKSSAVSLLVRKAVEVKPGLRVLLLDPHNEYAHAFRGISITLDSNILDLPHWLFRFDEFLDVIYRGRTPPAEEADILRELVPLAKSKFAVSHSSSVNQSIMLRKSGDGAAFTPDSPSPYRMIDLISLIDDMMGKLDPKHDRYYLRVLKGRLEGISTDSRYRFMFGRGVTEDNIEPVLCKLFRIPHGGKPITVLHLAGLPSEVLNAVVSVMARLSFDLSMHSGDAFEVLVLCEEAHRYVPQDLRLGFGPTRQSISRIAKEGRKYGCYIGIVTQRPGELDPTILSQCSTVFAMRLGNERDKEIIREAISDSSASQITFLSAIGNREAIAFGEGVATPMRMRFATQNPDHLPCASLHAEAVATPGAKAHLSIRSIVGRMRGASDLVDPF